MAAVSLVLLVVLRHILLPFVIGLALAYLLSPLVSMLERRGIDRAFSTLTIMLLLVSGFVAFTLIMLPALVGEVTAFVGALPRYLARIQSLAADANSPWVRKIVGHELALDQPSTEMISGAGGHWFDDVLRSRAALTRLASGRSPNRGDLRHNRLGQNDNYRRHLDRR